MDSLKDIISDIRIFMYGGMQNLPLTLAGTFLIVGLFTANYAILFFLLGMLLVVPFATFLLNGSLGALLVSKFPNIVKVRTSDICKIVIPYTTLQNPVQGQEENVIFSPWLSMTVFFIGYLFTNSMELYYRVPTEGTLQITPSEQSDIQKKENTRKTQAMLSMASILLFGLIMIGFRMYSGCESMLGAVLTVLFFSYAGRLWYGGLSSIGEDRLSDLFGIANRLLPPSAIENKPIACVPIPA